MRELELKLTGLQYSGENNISIDGEQVKFKKNQFGSLVCKYQTENDKVNVKVFTMLDVGGFIWFLTQLFFFVISIFGIFDIHRKESCLVVDYEAEFDLKEENKITLQFDSPRDGARAVNVGTDLTSREACNKFYFDKEAKRTLKILTVTKIFLAIAIIASVTAALIINL